MSDISLSLKEMVLQLSSLCPILTPSIFPCTNTISSIDQLYNNSNNTNKARKWLDNNTKEPGIAFITESVSSIDETLYSLEKVMKMLVVGNEQELNVMIIRFLQVNGYTGNIAEERHIFYEAYNLAYSIKVICSNIPGLQVTFNNMSIPISNDVAVNDIMEKYCIVGGSNDNNDDDDNDDDNDDNDIKNDNDKKFKKKRNRKRSKN